jgi:hypothetical protein
LEGHFEGHGFKPVCDTGRDVGQAIPCVAQLSLRAAL